MYVTHFRITVAAINNEGGIGENTTYIRATGYSLKIASTMFISLLGSPFSVDSSINLMVNRVTALTAQVSWTTQTDNQNLRLQYRRLGNRFYFSNIF